MRPEPVLGLETQLDLDRVRRALGGPQAVPAPMTARLEALAAEMQRSTTPTGSVVTIGLAGRRPDAVETVDGVWLHGLGVAGLLRRCEQLAAFAVSLGPGPEELMRQSADQGRLVDLALLDAMASEAVEALAEQAQAWVERLGARQGRAITRRYSPGYCDWPLEDQAAFRSWHVLAQAGIELNPAFLMIPEKSISAIVGLGAAGSLGHKLAARPDCRRCPRQADCPGPE